MSYMGNEPIVGMSVKQQKAAAAAARLGAPEKHDGIMRGIAALLPGPAPWSDGAVEGAIKQALAELGIDAPWLS